MKPHRNAIVRALTVLLSLVAYFFYAGLLVTGIGAFFRSLGDPDAYLIDRWANGLAWIAFFGASYAVGKLVKLENYTLGAAGLDVLEVILAYGTLVSLGVNPFKLELDATLAPDSRWFILLLIIALALQQWWRELLQLRDRPNQTLVKVVAIGLLLIAILLPELPTWANRSVSAALVLLTIFYSCYQPKEISFFRKGWEMFLALAGRK